MCLAFPNVPKYLIVLFNPSSNCTPGTHPKVSRAREMSGFLCIGSSEGSGLKTNLDEAPVSLITISANCRMVNSCGLPRLMGPGNP